MVVPSGHTLGDDFLKFLYCVHLQRSRQIEFGIHQFIHFNEEVRDQDFSFQPQEEWGDPLAIVLVVGFRP